MIEKRDIQKEIKNLVELKKAKQNNKNSDRLDELKTRLNSVRPYETPLKDYQKWVKEYNELLGR